MIINRKTRIALALAALLGFAWGPVLGLPADADSSSPPSWARGLPACEVEDGSYGPLPCYWDAGNMGNGIGDSFINWADGTWTYVPFCQYDVYGRDIGVTGYGFKPGAKVAVRVNGRTLRGKLNSKSEYDRRTKGRYTQIDVRVRVNGRLCEGT